jgi:4-alpha-glucanotransferase
MYRLPRASGILLHPTSLPGRFGIGDLGPAAEGFLDVLTETGQHWWQMLPLGPTGFGNSPYQSHSSFAGNPLLISPERLVADGWLAERDLDDYPELPEGATDYDAAREAKEVLFRKAYSGLRRDDAGFKEFARKSAGWLDDYALYQALKTAHEGRAWSDWEPEVAGRRPEALAQAKKTHADLIRYHKFVQYLFAVQWERLRGLCRERNIQLIGDLPIFVAADSADVWARPELFELLPDGRPALVSGVPPDFFSETGQLWGNPHYLWPAHEAEKYAWWASRLRGTTDRVDLVRIDHFRGFEAYWEIPGDAPTAATGRWVLGPGADFFKAIRKRLGGLPFIAEDLGVITPGVEALRDAFDMPGMRVLQFAFGDDAKANDYLPYSFIPHCVAYTGTHDNDTTLGWFRGSEGNTTQSEEVKAAERTFILRYLGTSGEEVYWDMIRLALGSVADTAIVPLQDVLGLGSEGRMNLPGTIAGNWQWRYTPEQLDPGSLRRLAEMTAVYARWNGPIPDTLRCRPSIAPVAALTVTPQESSGAEDLALSSAPLASEG